MKYFKYSNMLHRILWGYSGEAYLFCDKDEIEFIRSQNYSNYFFNISGSIIVNRTKKYYSIQPELCEKIRNISMYNYNNLVLDYKKYCTKDNIVVKYCMYTYLCYILNIDCKTIDYFYSYSYSDEKYILIKEESTTLCNFILILLLKKNIKKYIKTIQCYPFKINSEKIQYREYIEMDNIYEIIIDFFLFKKEIIKYDFFISVLFGGSLIAPLYSGLVNIYTKKKVDYSYIKMSLYDGHRNIIDYKSENYIGKNILVIDDNIGSGETLKKIEKYLYSIGIDNVKKKAIEYHWEKFFRLQNETKKSFNIDEIDLISPVVYRHYLKQQLYINKNLKDGNVKINRYICNTISDIVDKELFTEYTNKKKFNEVLIKEKKLKKIVKELSMKEIIGSGVLIVERKDEKKILLGKRATKSGFGEWSMPGGKCKKNEDFFVTAYREVKEETGICLDNLNFLFESEDFSKEIYYKTSHFMSKCDILNKNFSENREFFEWKVFEITNLPQNIFSFSKETIEYYRRNILKM